MEPTAGQAWNAATLCATTGRSPRSAKSLSNPMRWLVPAATMMAVSIGENQANRACTA